MQPQRAIYLDLFKTLLIVGMVLAHVIQLVDVSLSPATLFFLRAANFITFAGFLFAFGAGLGLRASAAPKTASWKTPVFLYLAYVASAFGYLLLVNGRQLNTAWIYPLLSMSILYAYSEYLATFFLLSLPIAFARKAFIALCDQPLTFFASLGLMLIVTTFKPDFEPFPLVAPLIGYHHGPTFPLLAYFPWFLSGFLFVRQGLKPTALMAGLTLAASLPCALYLYIMGELPPRDPPDVFWILGPAFILFLYLALTQFLAKRFSIPAWLTLPGRHALFYLVASSLTLFALVFGLGRVELSLAETFALTLVLLLAIGVATKIYAAKSVNGMG